MAIGKDEFRSALSRFASGVTVVTTKDNNGKLYGITVSAFCSVSLAPPLVLICIEENTGSHRAINQSKVFVVNVLHEHQQNISNQFAARLEDKFSGIPYHSGIDNAPVLENVLANLECRLVNSHKNGDHTIFIGEIEKTIVNNGNPLLYFHGNYRKIDEKP